MGSQVSHYHPNARTAEVEPLWALVASHLRACMYQCRRWLLAADESALVEAEWHVATMLAFARRGADGSSQYTTRALCVFLTLLQYHQAQSSAPALELFFRTATSKASPALAGDYEPASDVGGDVRARRGLDRVARGTRPRGAHGAAHLTFFCLLSFFF